MNIKLLLLMFFTTISCLTMQGQKNDFWTSFYNNDSTLIGYKDKTGFVKIEPKFAGFTFARKFENIIAVTETNNGKWNSYYLTKQGRNVGIDSLYTFDNSSDCESEGFIRFRDIKTDKVGMFNKNGDVVIPAIYNELSNVKNGMIIALKGAERKFWDGGEHYSWDGGQQFLIDTKNNILIENFKLEENLNFFSIEKSTKVNTDSIRKSFLAIDGSYYSFVDFEKEFIQWITSELQNDLTFEKLIGNSYETITWASKDSWTNTNKEKFNNLVTCK